MKSPTQGSQPASREGGAVAAGLTGYVTAPGFEAALLRELGKLDGPRWPSLLTSRSTLQTSRARSDSSFDPAFALQIIPSAQQVRGESVRDLVVAADAALADVLGGSDGPLVVHSYVPDSAAYRTVAGRAALLGTSFVDHLREHRRRVSRRIVAQPTDAAFREATLVQLVLVGRTSLLISAARPRSLATGGVDLA
ncbi:MAG TPA: hypothetical protein VGF45_05135, partial [Polyangia bacterium]